MGLLIPRRELAALPCAIRLMRYDMIDSFDTDPKCARGLGSAIRQFGTAGPHRLKVVLEIDRSSLGKRLVGAAGGECESGSPAENICPKKL